ncbi:hypothetical protein AVEN_157108-1 [Araneus ventricosus]|uniref:Pre-C2HC domain-containing protein n=1 Tax=Araneus ventricosus TaxID=182803 RepID=A0A4Y2HHP9_ARAVE|nr:hypothetical protein AVEN_157108-1 [Araneus ventricosus]
MSLTRGDFEAGVNLLQTCFTFALLSCQPCCKLADLQCKTAAIQINFAAKGGAQNFTFLFQPAPGKLPKIYPKALKDNLALKLTNTKFIELLNFTPQGKKIIKTNHVGTAIELSQFKALLGIPILVSLRIENIITRFLLRVIPSDTILSELKIELEDENDCKIHDMQRFIIKENPISSENILITIYGINMPPQVKVCLTSQRISLLIDRPIQGSKCFKFSHPTRTCSEHPHCIKCGKQHNIPDCTASSIYRGLLCNGEHMVNHRDCPVRKQEEKFWHSSVKIISLLLRQGGFLKLRNHLLLALSKQLNAFRQMKISS